MRVAAEWQRSGEPRICCSGARSRSSCFSPRSRTRLVSAPRQTLARLSHPGLVTVFDAVLVDGAQGQRSFLITEFVRGHNLRQRLDESSPAGLPADEVSDLATQLSGALAYVHAAGIVHRDVKPANILLAAHPVGTQRIVKLADFGIALLAENARLTEDGSTIGTANYLSPEQVTGSPVGSACDVYSLGLVLIECLTGEIVYPGGGVEAAVARLHRPPCCPGASARPGGICCSA